MDLPPSSPQEWLILLSMPFFYLFWTVGYIYQIQRQRRDQTMGVPLLAICFNLSWEILFTFVFENDRRYVNALNALWLIPNCFIFYQFLKYDPGRHRQFLAPAALTLCLILVYVAARLFQDQTGTVTAHFIQLFFSVVVLVKFLKSRDCRGFSYAFAWLKMLAAYPVLLVVTLTYPTPQDPEYFGINQVLYLFILPTDLFYVWLFSQRRRLLKA